MDFLMANIMHHNRLAMRTAYRFGREVVLGDVFLAEFAPADGAIVWCIFFHLKYDLKGIIILQKSLKMREKFGLR